MTGVQTCALPICTFEIIALGTAEIYSPYTGIGIQVERRIDSIYPTVALSDSEVEPTCKAGASQDIVK